MTNRKDVALFIAIIAIAEPRFAKHLNKQRKNGTGGQTMPDLKPCYGKCESCVWKYNGGCSEWNGWYRRDEEVGNDNGQE